MNTLNVLKPLAIGSLVCLISACGGDGGSDHTPPPAPPAPVDPTPVDPTPVDPVPTGAITLAFDTSTVQANDLRGLAFASNGKIYVSGHSNTDPADRKTVVARFNADGSPDTTFDGDGFVELNLAVGGDEQTLGIVELANGDVVFAANVADRNGGQSIPASDNSSAAAGTRAEGISIQLVRLAADGSLVTSFGNNGRKEVVFGWSDASNGDWPVPTYHSVNGFSHNGFPIDSAWDLELDKSGAEERLVVFGFGASAPVAAGGTQRTDYDRYVARVIASTGEADPAFNAGKAFTWSTAGTINDGARNGIVESDGRIVSSGYTNLGSGLGNHIILFRLTSAGELDPTFTGFGTDPVQPGVAVFNPFKVDGGVAEAYGVGRQSSGAYVTTGYGSATAANTPSTLGYVTTASPDLVTFRVANGAIDTSWGNNGTQAIQSESLGRTSKEERGRHMTVLKDDRVMEVGYFAGTPAVYVLTANGQPDASVDGDGILEFPHATITQQFFSVVQSADGKRIAATTSNNANGARLLVLDVDL